MSRSSVLILLGAFTILTPFSGFPIAVRSFLLVLFGVSVLTIGFSIRATVEAAPQTPHVPPPVPAPESETPHGISPI